MSTRSTYRRKQYSKFVDSSYIPSQGKYWTRIDDEPADLTNFYDRYSLEIENGQAKNLAEKNLADGVDVARATHSIREKQLHERRVDRDANGLPIAVHYSSDGKNGPGWNDAKVEWGSDGVKSVRDREGTDWQKIGNDLWKKTTSSGKSTTEHLHIAVDLAGDITFSNKNGMRIDVAGGFYDIVNNKGQLVTDAFNKYRYEYTYKPDGAPYMFFILHTNADSKTTQERKQREIVRPHPIRF